MKFSDEPGFERELHRYWNGHVVLRVTSPNGDWVQRRFAWQSRIYDQTFVGSLDNMMRALRKQTEAS